MYWMFQTTPYNSSQNLHIEQLLQLKSFYSTHLLEPGLWQLSVVPYRQAWQADVGLSKQVDVQGVAIQTDVLQVTADEVGIMLLTEGVLMQRLDVVILNGIQEGYCSWLTLKSLSIQHLWRDTSLRDIHLRADTT